LSSSIHPFDDARLLIDRAGEHVQELESRIQRFIASNPWPLVIERHGDSPQYVHKLRLVNQIDRGIKLVAADALRNLRASLDFATATCARLNGAPRLRNLYFPFLNDPANWETTIRRKCGCVPNPVTDFFRSLTPWPGGDEELRTLNMLRNDNDHWALTKIALDLIAAVISRPGVRQQIIQVPRSRGGIDEIELLLTPEPKADYHLACVIEIRFEEVPAVGGTLEMVLRNLAKKVIKIVDETEGIMRRGGFPV
jgi:hypothetical protein